MKSVNNILFSSFFILCFAGCLDVKKDHSNYSGFDLSKVKFDVNTYSVVVIGGGVGGLTSAIYLAQAGYKPVVIEGPKIGGNITDSPSVKNWPAEVDISGKALLEKILNQAVENGVKILEEKVVATDFSKWPYVIQTQELKEGSSVKEIKSLSCIIAIGVKPNYLGVPGEKEYFGRGISNCAICDGFFYKDKVVAIVGGGNAAIGEAAYLSNIAKKVLIFVRKDHFRVGGKLKEEVISKNNVEVFYNVQIKKIEGDGKKVSGVILYNDKTKEEKTISIDGLFLAIGSTPNSSFFKDQLNLDSDGYIKLINVQETSKMGIFAVGDVAQPRFKQAIIAAGDGAKAAIQVGEFLENIGFDPKSDTREIALVSKQIETSKKEIQEVKESNKEELQKSKVKVEEEKVETKDLKGLVIVKNQEHFDSILKNTKLPVFVDFFAGYCGPCWCMVPIVEKLVEDLKDKALFLKVDILECSTLAARYEVQSLPTFLCLNSNGGEVDRIIGRTEYEILKSAIEKLK